MNRPHIGLTVAGIFLRVTATRADRTKTAVPGAVRMTRITRPHFGYDETRGT